ncbi:SAM hydrolase/SAM-dependent halogenase family protein [Humisphaera borealis]|uniref:SAM-dependent chlorinase/fluorinase n=1 Tax=Humisphaera borealis TaxID=2807512 RepID=A0A7M2WWD4_9BACT|nr:SAM-dependent chlorinase/fluorinase [Humisphaera borealis]QOV89858.1 SAM-dependent chlorinase/fluorinase [Humisphaera borealis]
MPKVAPTILTLTTDFGTDDFYVGTMKGSMLRHCPGSSLIDITHAVPRHDVLFGAIMLERAIAAFPPGTIHLAVVDPGVGTSRRMVIARWPGLGQTAVCPDNGLLTWAWRRHGPAEVWELSWRPARASSVFHGRDIMGPAAAMLAAGTPIEQIAERVDDPILLDVAPLSDVGQSGEIIHIDRFGNATTNVTQELSASIASVSVAGKDVGPVRRTYGDVATGEPLALIGSSGLVEIAVREGSAAEVFSLQVGDVVELLARRL